MNGNNPNGFARDSHEYEGTQAGLNRPATSSASASASIRYSPIEFTWLIDRVVIYRKTGPRLYERTGTVWPSMRECLHRARYGQLSKAEATVISTNRTVFERLFTG